MADLRTRYLGLELSAPVIASCSPLTGKVETLTELVDAGAGAVVLPSLFQEEVEAEEMAAVDMMDVGSEFAEFDSAPIFGVDLSGMGTQRHLDLVAAAKAAVQVPVIASLNGTQVGGWVDYAKDLVAAGADAIELNLFSVNADPDESSAQVEERYLEIISAVRAAVQVPLAVKLSQHFTGFASFAARAKQAGADGLVLFNRFYGAEVDLEARELTTRLALSTPDELRYPLRWIGILRAQHPDLGLAATSGVHSGLDAAKALLVGADVACTTSEVLHNGPKRIGEMIAELNDWLDEHEYTSVDEARGAMSMANVPDPGQFERAQYMKVVTAR